MADLNINVVAHELDPSKRYIIEIRRGDLPLDAFDKLRKALQAEGITALAVVTETGDTINVTEIPEEV